jgi:hypothetical protein
MMKALSLKEKARTWVVQRKPHVIDRIKEFISQGIVAIGWPELRFRGMSRRKMRSVLEEYHSDNKRSVTRRLNAIWAFVNEIEPGDLVMVPDGKGVYVGKVASDYFYDATKGSDEEGYSNQRKVEWRRSKPYSKKSFPKSIQRILGWRLPPVRKLECKASQVMAVVREKSPKPQFPVTPSTGPLPKRPIGRKAEAAILSLRKETRVKISRDHNTLINAFNTFLKRGNVIDESYYDALIYDWRPGRHLLIEAKSKVVNGVGRHQVREAIGQLYDYRYMLSEEDDTPIDLALLAPEEPPKEIKELVYSRLGIELIWREGKVFHGTEAVERWLLRRQKLAAEKS